MLTISVEFLHGTFRADPDGSGVTGRQIRGEWPPAPSRLFAALVAADGTGDRCRVTDGSELRFLEQADAPFIFAEAKPWHQRLEPRFVVEARAGVAKSTHQEYLARKGARERPGVRVALRNPRVMYSWDVDVPDKVLHSLSLRAARVGYLGTSDSPVRLRVMTENSEAESESNRFLPSSDGDIGINVPRPGQLELLDEFYEQWLKLGPDIGRSQFPALRNLVSYRSPDFSAEDDAGSIIWLLLERPVSGRRITTVTSLLKQAVLVQHERIHGEPPPVLHGHGYSKTGYELARYLALPDVGYKFSKGRIYGLAVYLPSGTDYVVQQRARDAVRAIRELTGSGIKVSIKPWMGQERPWSANPSRWTEKSTRWVTAFPAVHERFVPLNLEEVSRWCAHAGLPAPVAFRSARKPLVKGAVDLSPNEVTRPGRSTRPYSHFEFIFNEPVKGPVVIGSGRQRGLGLCVPISLESPKDSQESATDRDT